VTCFLNQHLGLGVQAASPRSHRDTGFGTVFIPFERLDTLDNELKYPMNDPDTHRGIGRNGPSPHEMGGRRGCKSRHPSSPGDGPSARAPPLGVGRARHRPGRVQLASRTASNVRRTPRLSAITSNCLISSFANERSFQRRGERAIETDTRFQIEHRWKKEK